MKQINNISFRILVLLVASIGLLACEKTTSNTASEKSVVSVENETNSASKLISKAKVQLQKAADARFEWNTTAPLISQAEEAEKSGDIKLAKQLAERALKEANNSLVQAKHADEHWQDHAIN